MSEPKKIEGLGIGVGPFSIILVLLVASMYALLTGMGSQNFIATLAITAILVGLLWVIWNRLSTRVGGWAVGGGGQMTMVLLVIAIVSFFFIAPYIKTSLNIQVLPLAWDPTTGAYLSGSMDVVWLLGLMLVTVIGIFLASERGKRKRY